MLDSIPGGKVLSESYDMSGKIAYALTNKTALGIGISYHTATMAKELMEETRMYIRQYV